MSKPPLLFFGNERLSSGFDASRAPTLRALIEAGYPIKAVVANFEAGRARKERKLEIKETTDKHNIPLLLPGSPKDIIEELKSFRAAAAVLVAYGRIIPQSIIDIFPRGIINIHPSALPKYRGPTPIESAILNGDPTLTVSLMQLAKAMDAGPVYAQENFEISETASKAELTQNALELGARMLIEHLPAILDGSLQPQPQDESKATYCQLITKSDALIDWQKPAIEITRQIRAYTGWPGSKTTLFNTEVTVVEAVANATSIPPGNVSAENGRLLVGTSKGSLEILKLRPASRKDMRAADFLRGIKS